MQITWAEIDKWWRHLSAEERFILWLRIGQDIGRTRSLDEVASLYPNPLHPAHVTRQAIHLIEKRALGKLDNLRHERPSQKAS